MSQTLFLGVFFITYGHCHCITRSQFQHWRLNRHHIQITPMVLKIQNLKKKGTISPYPVHGMCHQFNAFLGTLFKFASVRAWVPFLKCSLCKMLNRLHLRGGHDSRLQHVYVAVNSGREAYTYYAYFTLCTLTSGMVAVEKGPSRPGLYRAWVSLPTLARNKVCKPDSQACVFGNRIIFGSARTSYLLTDQIFSFFYSPFLDRFF